jgi:hypothetical protein
MPRSPKPTAYATRSRMNATPVSIPAPVAGLNVRDGLAAMDARFAVEMTNMWPTAWGVYLRRGWQEHAAVPGRVRSLMTYAAPSGVEALFAVPENGNIYDVTAPSLNPPISSTGLTSYLVESVNFTNVYGTSLVCVNGTDAPFRYDGTAWSGLVYTGWIVEPVDPDPGTPLDPTKLVDVELFKRRLWFVEKDSTRAWYGATDELQGELKLFDVGEIFPRGGWLKDIGTWTVDTGTGINDNLVFVSSEGDIALFSGIDPEGTDFNLIGVYGVGNPINRRTICKRGGDLLIATDEGIMSMAAIMAEQSELDARTITDAIKPLLSEIAISNDQLDNWDLLSVNRHEMLIYNARSRDGITTQFVMNNTTKAWTTFTDVEANCWATREGEPYFGGTGIVGKFWVGGNDAQSIDGTIPGVYVHGRCVQAFNYFNTSGQQKHFRMARPVLRASTQPSVDIAMLVDYNPVNPTYAQDPGDLIYNYAVWDVSLWDEALWGQAYIPFLRWFNVGAIGMAGAVAFSMKCAGELLWISTDVTFESGGVL